MGDQKIISRNGKNDSLANPRWIRKDNRASASASERESELKLSSSLLGIRVAPAPRESPAAGKTPCGSEQQQRNNSNNYNWLSTQCVHVTEMTASG